MNTLPVDQPYFPLRAQPLAELRGGTQLSRSDNVHTSRAESFLAFMEDALSGSEPAGRHTAQAQAQVLDMSVPVQELASEDAALSRKNPALFIVSVTPPPHTTNEKKNVEEAKKLFADIRAMGGMGGLDRLKDIFSGAQEGGRVDEDGIVTGYAFINGLALRIQPPQEGCPEGKLTVLREDGLEVTIEMNADVRINVTSEGELSLFYPDSHICLSFDTNGKAQATPAQGSLGSDGDDIIVNRSNHSLDCGKGNDFICNLLSEVDIAALEGNKTLFFPARVTNVRAALGSGDHTLIGKEVESSTFRMGDGNASMDFQVLQDSRIKAGLGTHHLGAVVMKNSVVNLGPGHHSIDVGSNVGSTVINDARVNFGF